MMQSILLASDLDRTIIPNGEQPESAKAREVLTRIVERPEIKLAYVSGRNKDLIQAAIKEYNLPIPDYAVGDVGTTIYEVSKEEKWLALEDWENEIAGDWSGNSREDILELLSGVKEIRLQTDNPAFQNKFKVSYYTDQKTDKKKLLAQLDKLLKVQGIKVALIFSIDEAKSVGLLDVLPKSATKIHAVEWLYMKLNFEREDVIFAGDSGNDIPALTSGLKAIMVKNTRQDVQNEVLALAKQGNFMSQVYVAEGGFFGMNGNFAAGVIEGLAHFWPEISEWVE